MLTVKDTKRATVRLLFDGRVVKQYHGKEAQQRFDQEVKVLRYLKRKGCKFVPELLEAQPDQLKIITTSCGVRVEQISPERVKQVFAELEQYGVRHDDAEARNITYRHADGRFCVIDFEFATILEDESPKATT
ncbi:MAG: hypothetical protein RI897_2549 [Verrucomicrobiota bacterium]|jgi:hypothetical protein